MTSSFRVRIRILQARRKRGAAGAAVPPPPPPTNFLLSKNVLKEILFTLQFLNEELNSFHSYKTHRFGLL